MILLEIWLRAVTECFVGYDPGKDQSKRQSNDDHDRSGEPGDCFGQRHDAKVVDCPVQIKPRNHDYDGWNGKRDPRITIVFFDQGRQKSCRERTAECGGCSNSSLNTLKHISIANTCTSTVEDSHARIITIGMPKDKGQLKQLLLYLENKMIVCKVAEESLRLKVKEYF